VNIARDDAGAMHPRRAGSVQRTARSSRGSISSVTTPPYAVAGASGTTTLPRSVIAAWTLANVATVLAIFLLTCVVHGVRLTLAPDIFGDEGLYYLVGWNMARGAGTLDDTGVFFWHPPLYPLMEAAWIWATNGLHGTFTDGLLDSRWINVGFSGATAVVLFLFVRRLAGRGAGLLAVALFVGDLFVQRINRRSMLETSAMFFILVGLVLFWILIAERSREEAPHRQRDLVLVGAAFGLGMLVKEVAILGIVVLGVYALTSRRDLLRPVAGVTGVALLFLGAWPVWAAGIGEWNRWLAFQLSSIDRITGLHAVTKSLQPVGEVVGTPGVNPGFLARFASALVDYGPTYALLAAGGLLGLLLVWTSRRSQIARFLLCWTAVSSLMLVYGQVASIGDQFFYYPVVAAVVVTAYASAQVWRRIRAPDDEPRLDAVALRRSPMRRLRLAGPMLPIVLAFAIVFGYDAVVWYGRFVVGRDDSYAQITAYVDQHVPPGSTIVVGADVSNFLLRPEYNIAFYRDTASIRTNGVRYFILSSKEGTLGYNAVTPQFYDWVLTHTKPLILRNGDTFWTLGLYEWVG
jgi:4-amino-4-deoxy-L-arabinose transferase-like glycosyltransferase